jgi:hypothetical protein
LKKAYLIIGVVLIVLGLLLAIGWAPASKEFVHEAKVKVDLSVFREPGDDRPLTERLPMYSGTMTNVKEGTVIVLKFKSLQEGSALVVIIYSKEQSDEVTKIVEEAQKQIKRVSDPEDYPEPFETVEKFSSGKLSKEYYSAFVTGEEGELKWTCPKDGDYIFMISLPVKFNMGAYDVTLTKEKPNMYAWFAMEKGSNAAVSFACAESNDQLHVGLVDEQWGKTFAGGGSVPGDKVLVSKAATADTFTYRSPEAGTYYVLVEPEAGSYPVKFSIAVLYMSPPEGTTLPLEFTYSVEGQDPGGPWYLGVIIMLVGVVVMVLAFRKPAVPQAPPAAPPTALPAYAPPVPPSAAPPAVRYCTSCGAQNPADSKFCKTCGQPQG